MLSNKVNCGSIISKFMRGFKWSDWSPNILQYHLVNVRKNFLLARNRSREMNFLNGNSIIQCSTAVPDDVKEEQKYPVQDNSALFEEIADGNPETWKKLKTAEFEIEILRAATGKVPNTMLKAHWQELLTLNSASSRKKYILFLFKIEKKRENKKDRQTRRTEKLRAMRSLQTEDLHLRYGMAGNTMFLRIYDQTIKKVLEMRTMAAFLYSPHVVFDCSYSEYMSKICSKYCARQISFAYAENRLHINPFHLRFCNVDSDSIMMKHLKKLLCYKSPVLPIDICEESYLNYYPKKNLVYLTPHCREVLNDFNPEDVYIIGAFVDKGSGEKVSLAKAKENNLRMAKFPIDFFLNWQQGLKSLPLNIVLKILLDLKLHKSWESAFKNIPSRFLHVRENGVTNNRKLVRYS